MSQPNDFKHREDALDVTQSWIVQAPAGSGKTGILVYRVLKLLALAKKPEEVLAITFTKKAAKEMRDRLISLLHDADQGIGSDDVFENQGLELAKAVLVNDKKYDWQLLDMPNRLNIETIDALCARLVANMPWLSRLGERPKTTDKADVHFKFAIEQLLRELVDQDSEIKDSLQALLLVLDNNFAKLRQLLVPMLGRRDQWLRHLLGQDFHSARSEFEEAWRVISEYQLKQLSDLTPVGMKQKLVELAMHSAEQRVNEVNAKPLHERDLKKLEFPSKVFIVEQRYPRADFADIELWRGLKNFLLTSTGLRKKGGINVKVGFAPKTAEKEHFIELLESLENHPVFIQQLLALEDIPPPTFSDSQWRKLIALERVLLRLISHLQLRFYNQKECDFSEVAMRANQALQSIGQPTDLALRLDYQIQHILVDEFQDTSHSQFTLLENLTKGWQASDGRTLFLVGDPMQSIYRFREADVGLFVKLAAGFGKINDIQLKPLVLTENFRSSQALVDWFNTVFSKSFPETNDVGTGAIQYSPATTNKAPGTEPEFYAFHDAETEAEHIVEQIQQAEQRGDKKIAILVRSRPQLTTILPALHAANIHYEGVDIKPLENTQEVLDVVSLCKAIIRLDDKVAWLSVLRGPMVGLTLDDITQLSEGADAIVWERIQNSKFLSKLSESGQKRVLAFGEIMALSLLQKHQVPLADLIQWTWLQLGGEHCLKTASLDDISVVWSLIRQLEEGGDIHKLSDLDAGLKGLFSKNSAVNNQQFEVIVSTMHKSKGLQFDTVILPSLTRKGANQDKEILRWAEVIDQHGQERLLLAGLENQLSVQQQNTHYNFLRILEKKRDWNEQLRLLYVACTRAESRLILSGVFIHNRQGELTAKNLSGSLLKNIWPEIKDQFFLDENDSQGILEAHQPDQTLYRLKDNYRAITKSNIESREENQVETNIDQPSSINEGEALVFENSLPIAQAVGIVLHDWLEHQSYHIETVQIESQEPFWRAELQSMGLGFKQIDLAISRLNMAVKNMRQDPIANWLFLDSTHTQIENEYPLTTVDQGRIANYRIDRTFIDKHGTRWIIDYKSTMHFDNDADELIDNEIEQRGHKQQLNRYAQAFSKLESRKIKLGLYFPLLKKWKEWAFNDDLE